MAIIHPVADLLTAGSINSPWQIFEFLSREDLLLGKNCSGLHDCWEWRYAPDKNKKITNYCLRAK